MSATGSASGLSMRTEICGETTWKRILVTADELDKISYAGRSTAKDFCQMYVSGGIPCLINAISLSGAPLQVTLFLILNWVVGVIGVGLGIKFYLEWRPAKHEADMLLNQIKARPVVASQTWSGDTGLQTSDDSGVSCTMNGQPG